MSIQELSLKFKGFLTSTEVLLALLIIAVSLASFFLGRFSVDENPTPPIVLSTLGESAPIAPQEAAVLLSAGTTTDEEKTIPKEGLYVGSKNGSKYHLPWCPGAKQIKDVNKVWFASKEEAKEAGYTPASNCKGI